MNMRIPKPTPRGRPRGPVLPDVLTRCLLLRSGRLNHPPGLGSTVWDAQTPFFPANKPFSTVRPNLRTPQGDGSLQAKLEYPAGGSLAIGDLNGDRKPDVVTAGLIPNAV